MHDYRVLQMNRIGGPVTVGPVALDLKDVPSASKQAWAPDAAYRNGTYYLYFADADFNTLVDSIFEWSNEGPTRVPLTDWYDTKTGKQSGFQARSVVGGLFIKALADKPLAQSWRARAIPK